LRPNHQVSLHRSAHVPAATRPLYSVWGPQQAGLFHIRVGTNGPVRRS
jgi:hypothetical protein